MIKSEMESIRNMVQSRLERKYLTRFTGRTNRLLFISENHNNTEYQSTTTECNTCSEDTKSCNTDWSAIDPKKDKKRYRRRQKVNSMKIICGPVESTVFCYPFLEVIAKNQWESAWSSQKKYSFKKLWTPSHKKCCVLYRPQRSFFALDVCFTLYYAPPICAFDQLRFLKVNLLLFPLMRCLLDGSVLRQEGA